MSSDEIDVINEMIEKLDNVKDVEEPKTKNSKPVPSEPIEEDIEINNQENKSYQDEDVSYSDYEKLSKEKKAEYGI